MLGLDLFINSRLLITKDFEFGKVFLSFNLLGNPFLLFCSCEILMNMMFGLKLRFDLGILCS